MDTWSTVTFCIFLAELVLLGTLMPGAFAMLRRADPERETESVLPLDVNQAPELTLSDDVLIDISSRYNEAVVANIDAVDTALVAILALPVAFAVFAVDKIRDLAPSHESLAMVFLLASCLASFVGYAWGFMLRGEVYGTEDGIVPRRFLADYMRRGTLAVADAMRTVHGAGEHNVMIRGVKRTFALGALIYFLLGAATVAAARLDDEFHAKRPSEVRVVSAIHFNNVAKDVVQS